MTKEIRLVQRTGRLDRPNELLVMKPLAGRLTLIGRKLYTVICYQSQMHLRKGRMLDATQFFEAPLRELLSPVGSETADYRALAKKYLTEMQEVTIEWDSPEGRAEVEWKRLKLISEVRFVKKGGETWVQWALPPTLAGRSAVISATSMPAHRSAWRP